ncbi:MAG: stage II sporulation protein M [Caldisericia bacterium]|nr:stage II sporulation protein M [Caldisericia bacterium]
MKIIKSVLEEIKKRRNELLKFFIRFFISFFIGAILVYLFIFFIENSISLNKDLEVFKNLLNEVKKHLENYFLPYTEKGTLGRILFIFLNNFRVVVIAGILSFITFGIFSEIVAYINGFVVGLVIFALPKIFEKLNPFSLFLFGIVPHGIFEIFAFLLSLTFAHSLSPTKEGIKYIDTYLKSYILVIPLLFIASIIEVTLTPIIMSILL